MLWSSSLQTIGLLLGWTSAPPHGARIPTQEFGRGRFIFKMSSAYHSRIKSWMHRFHLAATKYLVKHLDWG